MNELRASAWYGLGTLFFRLHRRCVDRALTLRWPQRRSVLR
jgi:hypothetical protein